MRIAVERTLALEFFAGREAVAVSGCNVLQLVRALDALSPGFGDQAAPRFAFAVNGVLATDWTAPLAPDAEVLLFPRVGGG